ncbi:MAG: hypothetical protein KGR26_12875 [Cyanobacteria bacterium REEB65]|nr:hypothetical protein [Cyanobacteria bacterium REEB65]
MPFFYKDTLNGRYPMISVVKLDDPCFVEITEAEWDVLRQAGNTEDHPYSPYVLNKDAMEAASRAHIPPDGTQIPHPPAPEHPEPASPAQGIIHEENK